MERQLYFSFSRISGDNNICDLSKPFRLNCCGYEIFNTDEKRMGCRRDFFCVLMDRGALHICVDDHSLSLTADQAIIIPPETAYRLCAVSEGTSCYWMHFTGCDVLPLLQDCGLPLACPVSIRSIEPIALSFRQLFGMFAHQDNCFAVETAGQCLRLLAQMGRLSSEQSTGDTLEEAVEYIHSHLSEPLTVETLAERQGISVSSFYRAFVNHMGVSPKQYIVDVRLTTACTLLRETDDTVEAIAARCGYSDYRYFCWAFRKREGVTPSAYRK